MARIGKDLTTVLHLMETKKIISRKSKDISYFSIVAIPAFLIRNLLNNWFVPFDANQFSTY